MIRQIKLIRNVGTFDSVTVSDALKRIVLIYAENASGKTTLAEVLRSLETGDPSIVTKMKKFGTTNKPHVILECDNKSFVMFKDGAWQPELPLVRVFDESFIDTHVYSGLDVESEHRKNLHDFVLGRQGVTLSRQREDIALDIERCNYDMKIAENAVPSDLRYGLSMDEFCDLGKIPDIDVEIENTQMVLDAAQDVDMFKTPAFEKIHLPAFDEPAIRAILQHDLQNLDTQATTSLDMHIASLGSGGEFWIAKGIEYIHDDDKCPFCGQATTEASLIKHYRAYFNEAYVNQKRNITNMLDNIRNIHSSNTQTTFERTIGNNKDVGHVWAKYGLQVPDIDTKLIMSDWAHALEAVERLLEAKRNAPLEPIAWNRGLLESYNHHRQEIVDINNSLDEYNEKIRHLRNADSVTIQSAYDKLQQLKVTKTRYLQVTASWCDKYIRARTDKAKAEEDKKRITQQLEKYRNNVFPALQEEVNHYLKIFGVRYTVQDLKPENIRSGSSCNYKVNVDNTLIDTYKPKSKDAPTIGSILSTSERNTLALTLFLSSLMKDKNLANTTVVVDDPVSSFDDNRTSTTIEELLKLKDKVSQIIILSHQSEFLYEILDKVRKDCTSLIIRHYDKGSEISGWNMDQKSKQTERRSILEMYAKYKKGDPQQVAENIRPYLEAVLKTIYANYDESKSVGHLLDKCRSNKAIDEATVDELRKIINYAKRFMHAYDPNVENRSINRDQLRVYVQRALDAAKMTVRR